MKSSIKYINESILNSFIKQLNSSKILTEATDEQKEEAIKAQKDVKDEISDIDKPEKVNDFLSANKTKYEEAAKKLEKKDPKKAGLLRKAWKFLAYAAKSGGKFLLKHWDLVLKLMFIIALAWASAIVFGWLCEPIKAFFATCGKNGKAIELMSSGLSTNAEKALSTAASMPMLGGGLR